MRLPIPDRFSPRSILAFCLLLFLGQQATGTDLAFSVYTAAFVIFAAIGFNLSGGLFYASGAFIFFNALLTAIFGLTFKVFLGEPGQNSLASGDKSMLVYAAGMFAMMCAAGLNSWLRPRRGLISELALGPAMKRAAAGCCMFGAVITVLTFSSGEGTLGSAFRQINRFLPMAILLGATYEFRLTGGRRAANWIVYCAIAFLFMQGVMSFSKEGMFVGPVTWAVAAVSLGYEFKPRQILLFAAGAFFAVYYLVPYSQYVRNFSSGSRSENVATALHYLGNLNETRRLFLEQQESHDIEGEPHLYTKPEGFFDRLNMLAFDDALISHTDDGNVFGLSPVFYSYANILPHFVWRNKPHFAYGNVYAHELGVIGDEDETTGISFSPAGDAYHEASWFGVLVVWFLVAFLFFFATDSLTGSARHAPWALLPISFAPHAAAEAMLGGYIFLTTYGIAALLVIVLFARYILPVVTSIFSHGGEGDQPALPPGHLHAVTPDSRI